MDQNKITIKLFGIAKDLIKDEEISIPVHTKMSVGEIRLKIIERYPMLSSIKNQFVLSVNHALVSDDKLITPDDKLSLLPPVSGG